MPPRCFGLVPAAGIGARFGATLPKQYLTIGDRPMIVHAIEALQADARIAMVVVVVSPDDARAAHLARAGVTVLPVGGATRADSVRNGLLALAGRVADDDRVLVHDAARPCLSREDLARLIDLAGTDADGGLLAVPMADTVKRAAGDRVAATVSRDGLWRASTPQLFPVALLREALARAADDLATITDEASAVERLGRAPRLVACSAANIKVTTPDDLAIAAAILAAQGRVAASARVADGRAA